MNAEKRRKAQKTTFDVEVIQIEKKFPREKVHQRLLRLKNFKNTTNKNIFIYSFYFFCLHFVIRTFLSCKKEKEENKRK